MHRPESSDKPTKPLGTVLTFIIAFSSNVFPVSSISLIPSEDIVLILTL